MSPSYLDPHAAASLSESSEWQPFRGASPAPTMTTLQGNAHSSASTKKPFMSKIFSRRKSKPTLHRTSTQQTTLTIDSPSRVGTPSPLSPRSLPAFHDIPPSPLPGSVKSAFSPTSPASPSFHQPRSPLAAGSHDFDSQLNRQDAQTPIPPNKVHLSTPNKPKTKTSFSTFASNLFRQPIPVQGASDKAGNKISGQHISAPFTSSPNGKEFNHYSSSGLLAQADQDAVGKGSANRKRASTVMRDAPLSPTFKFFLESSTSSGQGSTSSGAPATFLPLNITKPKGPSTMMNANTSGISQNSKPGSISTNVHTLVKSCSTPELSLYAAAKRQSIPASPSFTSNISPRGANRPALGLKTQLPSLLDFTNAPRSPSMANFKASPSPTVTKFPAGLKISQGMPTLSPTMQKFNIDRGANRSHSPAPSGYAMSTMSKKTTKTYLDRVLALDIDDPLEEGDMGSFNYSGLLDDSQEEDHDAGTTTLPKGMTGLSVKVAKEIRPNTGGTFGRPHTGTRPNTGNRPTTGVSRPDTADTDRPWTGLSAVRAGDTKQRPIPLRLDGRLRRLSNVSSSSQESAHEDRSTEPSSNSTHSFASQLSLSFDNDIDSSLTSAKREDSGFSDRAASAVADKSYSHPPMEDVVPPLPTLHLSSITKFKPKDFRPTTADTTHLPLDLPDIDIAFDPRASLGSLGRQSSVSELSDFEEPFVKKAAQEFTVSSPDVACTSDDADATPRKHVMPAANSRLPSASAPPVPAFSVMSRLLLRKRQETDLYIPRQNVNPHGSNTSQAQMTDAAPAIVMTFAESDVPLGTPLSQHTNSSAGRSHLSSELAAAETARINDPHDPYAGSYFPPAHTLLPPSPRASTTPSTSTAVTLAKRDGKTESDIVERLMEALERETLRREALEYSLTSLRESTGADLRRSDQNIKELLNENKRLLDKLARLVSI